MHMLEIYYASAVYRRKIIFYKDRSSFFDDALAHATITNS
jgi:hypothetical protein